ncbi:hypothetical protein HN958_00045 [Candidatus Falkowbacteria bacterium]|mgnify:CR=1 FL=1|jgi:hypothetical protein|nr:hypothetical protein [Candidatus Falkowbacteria bacterium]MBT7006878.1 hypothetical protein [Candidatus Falkowbacteria bacterium]
MKFLKKVLDWSNENANIYWLLFILLVVALWMVTQPKREEHHRLAEHSWAVSAELKAENHKVANELYVELYEHCDNVRVMQYFAFHDRPWRQEDSFTPASFSKAWSQPFLGWRPLHEQLANAVEFYRLKGMADYAVIAGEIEQRFLAHDHFLFSEMLRQFNRDRNVAMLENPLYKQYRERPYLLSLRTEVERARSAAPSNPFIANFFMALCYAALLLAIIWGILDDKLLFPSGLELLYFTVGIPALSALYFWQY